MIHQSLWHRIPSEPIREVLPHLRWGGDDRDSPAADAAALMLYVALNFMAITWADASQKRHAVAAASYEDLMEATGLSRKLVSAGLKRLLALNLIASEGSHQKRRYQIRWPEKDRFFKLPCSAIVHGNVIRPFKGFNLRAKEELHALKLYLYYARIRPNHSYCSMASFETIFERTGIPERDIRRANSLLVTSGLLVGVDKEHNRLLKTNEPNKYYLTGYHVLVREKDAAGEGDPTQPPSPAVAGPGPSSPQSGVLA